VTDLEFGDDFLWGVATSAYQIEGAVHEDGRAPSIWDTFCRVPGAVANGEHGDVACDHYHRWGSDLDLVAGLGLNAYRFSIAWPRVVPAGRGRVNEVGLDFYERLVDGMLERGLAPFATLYHWDLPQALQDEGGWESPDIVGAFTEYAEVVARRLGDRVAAYATLNDPWCSSHLGYASGEHAPGVRDRRRSLQVAHHLLLAHGQAIPVLRAAAPASRHGIVLYVHPVDPARDLDEDRAAAERYDGFFNRWYLDPVLRGRYPEDVWAAYGSDVPRVEEGDLVTISAPIDFLGVNYYSRAVVSDDAGAPYPSVAHERIPGERTGMDWEVVPDALTRLLIRLQREYGPLPLYVTENGAAYGDERWREGAPDDADRRAFIEGHIRAVAAAIAGGADVRGYFAWSLMDNFEWTYGYAQRFGIVHVDFATQARTPRASARWYAEYVSGMRVAGGTRAPGAASHRRRTGRS
jgi:beta-glucosidase